MLQKINERVSGWVSWIIIILIAFTFVLFGANYYVSKGQRSQVKMTINGEEIGFQEYDGLYRRIRTQFQQFNLPASFIKKQADQEFIKTTVEKQSALNNGFFITPEQVRLAIMSVPEFQENGEFSQTKFERVLASVQFTPSSFFEKIKLDLLARQQQFSIENSSFALSSEAEKLYQFLFQKRDYQSILFNKDNYLKTVTVSDKEIKEYYAQHKNEFLSDETVTLEYVMLDQDEIAKNISVSEKEISDYYTDNKASFIEPAHYKIQHLLISKPIEGDETIMSSAKSLHNKVKKGEKFSDLIKAHSADLLSEDGVLPEGSLELFPKSYAKVVTTLKTGELSKPFESEDGVEIIKLIKVKKSRELSLAESKEKIQSTLKKDKTQAEFTTLGETLSDVSYQEPDSLVPVAEALSLKVQTIGPLTKKGSKEGLAANEKLIKAAFNKEQLSRGENSEPLQLDEEQVIVFRIKEHVKPKVLPLSRVQDKVKTTLTQKKAKALAEQKAKSLVNLLEKGNREAVDSFLKNNQLEWNKVVGESKEQKKKPSELQTLAFTLAPSQGKTVSRFLAVKEKTFKNGNSVVVALTKVEPGNFEKLPSEEKASFQDNLANSLGQQEYALYMNHLIKDAKVKVF